MNNTVMENYTEKLTYQEWESIHKALKEEKRTEKRYFTKQRICGGLLVAVSVLLPVLLQDITASVFLLPLGIGVMVTKDNVI